MYEIGYRFECDDDVNNFRYFTDRIVHFISLIIIYVRYLVMIIFNLGEPQELSSACFDELGDEVSLTGLSYSDDLTEFSIPIVAERNSLPIIIYNTYKDIVLVDSGSAVNAISWFRFETEDVWIFSDLPEVTFESDTRIIDGLKNTFSMINIMAHVPTNLQNNPNYINGGDEDYEMTIDENIDDIMDTSSLIHYMDDVYLISKETDDKEVTKNHAELMRSCFKDLRNAGFLLSPKKMELCKEFPSMETANN